MKVPQTSRFRLRTVVSLLLIVPLLAFAAATLVVTRQLEKKALREELSARARDLAIPLAQNLGAAVRGDIPLALYSKNFSQLTGVGTFRREVVYLNVLAARPGLSYSWSNPDLAWLRRGENVRVSRTAVLDANGKPIMEDGKPKIATTVEYRRIYPIIANLRGLEHEDIGSLEFGLSTVPIEKRLQALAWQQSAVASFFVLASGLLALRLTKRLSRPIEALEGAVATIAAGGIAAELSEYEGSKEIRSLTTAFNRMNRELDEKKRMAGELRAARDLQEKLFPRRYFEGYRCRAIFESKPANEVGGDFYTEIRWPSEGNPWMEIALGDVSGKGMGAALLAATTHGVLLSFREDKSDIPDVIRHVTQTNQVLCSQSSAIRRSDFVALLIAAINIETGEVTFVNGGQIPPLIQSPDGIRFAAANRLSNSPPLGVSKKFAYKEHTFQLGPDETLILLSDGVIEAMDEEMEELGFDRLFSVGIKVGEGDIESRHRAIFRLIESHAAGAPQHDDATVVFIERLP